jgi:XTP/dITP diphosphohydrolase
VPQGNASLLIATNNQGKRDEVRSFLADVHAQLFDLGSFTALEVEENGATFDENARLKASGYARQAGMIAVADDSGLEVAALDGSPGVLSARYGGPEIGFDEKMSRLLAELAATGDADRRARFVAVVAIADETGRIIHTAKGICPGHIAASPRGTGGFGYDPIFIPDGYDLTFGELSEAVKQKISHRARAFSQIIPFLRGFFAI